MGYETFEATVGINHSTEGRGSTIVSVHLDGRLVFMSNILTGTSEPSTVRVPLGNAREILLLAAPTDDGKRFDHVDWADARFVRSTHGE